MISSITTTVSAIINSAGIMGISMSLGIAAVLTLIVGLVVKELSTGQKTGFRVIGNNLQITILPLVFVLVSIICTQVWSVLS